MAVLRLLRRMSLGLLVVGLIAGLYVYFQHKIQPEVAVETSHKATATYYYPPHVAPGPPGPATQFSLPGTLPTGGLANVQGQAASWAIGSNGALIVFINPGNPYDGLEILQGLVPLAQQRRLALDVVDTVPVTQVGLFSSASNLKNAIALSSPTAGVSSVPQTLAQMGSSMNLATRLWHLPAWVHLYVVETSALKSWKISLQEEPTLWVVPLSPLGGVPQVMGDNSLDFYGLKSNTTFVDRVL